MRGDSTQEIATEATREAAYKAAARRRAARAPLHWPRLIVVLALGVIVGAGWMALWTRPGASPATVGDLRVLAFIAAVTVLVGILGATWWLDNRADHREADRDDIAHDQYKQIKDHIDTIASVTADTVAIQLNAAAHAAQPPPPAPGVIQFRNTQRSSS